MRKRVDAKVYLLSVLIPVAFVLGLRSWNLWSNYKIAEESWHKGEAYLMSGQFDRARREFHNALKLYPEFKVVWDGLAVTYHWEGRHDEELKVYEKSLDIFPDDFELSRSAAIACHEIGRHDLEYLYLVRARRAEGAGEPDPFWERLYARAKGELSFSASGLEVLDAVIVER